MKHKKLKTCAVLLLGLGLQATQAETALFVKQKVGSNTPFNMSTLKSLTFAAGNVLVNQKDATTSSFARANVQYMNFAANIGTGILPEKDELISKLSIFPNPVLDILSIANANGNNQNTRIEIVANDGKIALRTTFNNAAGNISVASLTRGFYICRIINGTIIQTQKFIKQ
ncbi:MAG: T9SS type A sorting domain-containing protein [Bacteroidales bacterium]